MNQTDRDRAALPPLIFACSGAADVGSIADQAARRLTRFGVGKMYCLAGVGGRVEEIMENTREASSILAIDGCPSECAKNCLQEAGFTQFHHIQLEELGMKKRESPPNEARVELVMSRAREMTGA